MRNSIQCWQCGTRITLDELASNDGDCPECEVEIYLGEYLIEALDTNQRLEAEIAALKAKAAVPEKYKMQPYQTVDKGSTNYKAGWNACINAMLSSATAQPQSDAVQSNDGEVIELLAKLRQMVRATPQNYIDRSGAWISTNHPVIKRIDALLGGEA